jgi:predicted enzyme related to lactoylglutathione lyase
MRLGSWRTAAEALLRWRTFLTESMSYRSVFDLDAARTFYRDVLELGEPLYDLPDAGWIEFRSGSPSGNIAVTQAPPDWQASTGTTIVLNVKDCHVAGES